MIYAFERLLSGDDVAAIYVGGERRARDQVTVYWYMVASVGDWIEPGC
ncbi:hypothetical protein [Tamilnaduibacter salinus]|nr:hypothetical protein [Tamilnaduibacter salinus]